VTLDNVLRFLTVFTSGIAAGVLVIVMIAVTPAMLTLPDEMALRFKQRFDPLVDRLNPAFVMISLVTGVILLIVADERPLTMIVATIVGLVGSAGIAASSMLVNLRINREMAGWSVDAPDDRFRPLIARWRASHAVRTLAGVTGFVGYLIAVLAVVD
jgi:uncharacterized membrane protein